MKIHVNYKVICLVAVSIFSLLQPSNCEYVNPNFPTNVDLYENAKIGTVVTNITDNQPGSNNEIVDVKYMGSDHDFYVQPGNRVWSVILNTTLDYDQGFTKRTLPMQASGSGSVSPADIFITLHVQDVNDNAPVFLYQPYNAEVDEDASAGTTVYTNIAAHDIDTARGGIFTFQLLDVSEGQRSKFVIDRLHGIVTLNGSLDYESRTFYHYKVVAKDEGIPSLNSTTDLFITVKDVQDSPPVFTNRPYVTSVPENTRTGHSVLTLRAVDQDRAIPNIVAYNITHSTCPDLFQLNATSGEISVARALDSDVSPLKNLSGLCVITVQATEQNGTHPQKGNFTAVATATITVTDVNDNAPTFSGTSFSANISENSPAGTPLQLSPGQQITVTDIDEGSNSEIQLSLESGADTFELVTSRLQSSGSVQLRVKNSTSLDFETLPSLVVKITARDSDLSHAAVTATVTVTVVNVNEYSPEFGQHAYTASVLEGSVPGTRVTFTTLISATDKDGGNLGTNSTTYSLTNDRGLFRIDPKTGSVGVVSNQTDREREDRYYMVVVATDGGGLQQTVPLTINITDRNDNPPIFLRDQYDVILDEGATQFSHSASIKLEATDADEEETANSNVTYSIDSTSPGVAGSHFHMDPVSGRLSVASALDYDVLQFPQSSAGIVKLVVVAKDNGSTRLSASVTVAVTLNDINDNGPSFQDTPYTTSIPERSNAGFFVFQVNASDQDGSSPNNVITYSIESGGQDRFRINPDNGTITVSGDIDREQVQNYTLVVIARDRAASPKSTSTRVRIDIIDINDELPTFGDKGDVRVDANETFRGVLYTMSATDADSNSHLQYSILYNESSGQSGTFQILSPSEIQSLVTINPNNGQISAASPLNRTVVQKLVLRVQVNDTYGTVKTPQIQTATLIITVVDINNQSPQFSPQGTVNATIRENMGQGTALTFISPFRVTDLDEGENSLFEVHVVGQIAADFEVVPSLVQSSADLVVKVKNGSLLDYEQQTHLSIKLLARETLTVEKHSSTVTITVSIEDENDNSPRFNASSYDVSIQENEAVGTTVTTVRATDDDRSSEFNTVTYSLQGAAGLFSIDNQTGTVRVTGLLDYETRREYQLTVEATDTGGLRDSVPLTITLLDVNDNAPQFLRPEYRAFVKENSPDFDGDILITATDKDGDSNNEIRYSISTSSELASNFTVNSTTGRLGLSGSSGLDFEALPNKSSGVVQLIIVASDNGHPSLSSSVSVLVTVADENDNSPVFAQVQPQNMSETAPLGASLVTVSATDGDGQAPNNKVFYVMSSGGNDKFKVDSSSGLVSRAGPLDSDTQNEYNLTISAIDGGSPAKRDTVVITVTIDDVNDEPPEFQPASRIISVNESNEMTGSDAGRVLTTLWATDPDANKVLLYDVVWTESRGFGPIQEGLDTTDLQDAFELDSSSGEIRVRSSLDRETLSRAVLVINVTDTNAATNSLQTSTGTLTINVLDVNDHKPMFNQRHYVVEIQENAVENTVLKMVSIDQMNVSDSDTDQNCVFSVSVEGSESDNFTAEPSSARSFALVQLRVRGGARLDYEETQSITFNVTARETDTSDHFSDTVSVTLNIIDVNDNDPKFTETNYSVSVPESSAQSTSITRIQAQDKDSGSFGQITYSLEGDSSRFVIDPSTGDLSTADSGLDRETKDIYLMTVVATDGGGRRSGAPLTITITDINDQSPRFQSNYSTKVKENSVDLSPPIVLQAPDDDQSNTANSNVTYHLVSCRNVPCANFSLNASSGHLVLNSALDFEKTRRVVLVVEARDHGLSPLTGTATVTVEVEDLNDMDPNFSQGLYTANITENAPEGTNLTSQVSASDGDGSVPNNVVFYVLDSGKGSDKFRVNSITGVVTVGTGAVLDREADASFNLRLLAFDRGNPPRSSSTTLSVSLVDVNDEGPVFTDARKEVSVYENASVSQEVELMNASDSDTDPGLVYTWLLRDSQATTDRDVEVNISQVAGWFRVDPDTGRVTVNGTLDREVAEVVVLKILVNDTKGTVNTPQTAVATLTVTLLDVNDNAPEIIGSDTMSVSEALAVGTEVYSLTAHDKDKDQSVVFSMLTGAGAHFNVSANGKIFLQNQVDREVTPTVSFTVIATDSGSPPLSSNITFNVTVLDANDNDPKFQNTSYVFTVPEDAGNETVVAIVNATDADEGPNANVTFDLADNVYDFVINTTGAILVKKKLDRERKPSYMFGVAALDNPTTDERRRAIQRITIEVQDVNDNAPILTHQHYVGQIDEKKGPGQTVLNMKPGAVQATDADLGQNANLSFRMTSQGDVQFFRMDPLSGKVIVNTSITGQAGTYNYTVTVADHGQPSFSASANLTIKIIDENINMPRFVGNYTNIHVAECITVGASITTFNAEDDDRDKNTNGKVQFFFDNATSNAADLQYFTLNKDTGELFSAKRFDRETQAQFHIGIKAQDNGLPQPLSTTLSGVTITISDANDEIPKFNTTQYLFSVKENEDNVPVGTVYAEDLDHYKKTCYSLVAVGNLSDHFNITNTTDRPAEIRLIRPLDREVPGEASVSLTVTARDCTETASQGCAEQNSEAVSTATVQVTVSDVNDNPPNFTKPLLTFGVASTADTGHVIVNLQEYVTDPDTGPNRVHAFYPVRDYELDKDLKPSFDPSDTPLAVTANGTVATHAALPGDARGFFTWEIMVNDTAGNDTVILKIYVVGKDKLLRLTFFLSMEELRQTQDNILRNLSNQMGLLFVADDRVQFEDDKGAVDPSKSVLVVHAIKNKKDVMDANELLDFLDHKDAVMKMMKISYKLYNIQTLKAAETKTEDKTKMEYILAAIICVVVVAFCITLYIMLNNIRRFKRKLKAATIETYAMAGQPKEAFPGLKTPQTNPIFGKDEDLPGKDFDNDNASEQSDGSLDQNSVDFDAEPGDGEQEVTMDLYSEDTDQPPNLRAGDHYLDEALAEHDRYKKTETAKVHKNGVGPRHNGAPPSVLLQGVDVDLQGLESTDI